MGNKMTECCSCSSDQTNKAAHAQFDKDKYDGLRPSQRSGYSSRVGSKGKKHTSNAEKDVYNTLMNQITNENAQSTKKSQKLLVNVSPQNQANRESDPVQEYSAIPTGNQAVSLLRNKESGSFGNDILKKEINPLNDPFSMNGISNGGPPKSQSQQLNRFGGGVTNNLNPRLLDETWLKMFKVKKFLNYEVFSDLYLVVMKKGGEERILRKIKKSIFKDYDRSIEEFRATLEEQIQIEHPNITQLFDYKEDEHNYYLLQEYCKGGKLFSQIEQLSEMTENLAAEITRQILSAIVYLHSKQLVYKGLSPDVLLLESDDKIQDSLNIKLINLDIQAAIGAAADSSFQSPQTLNNLLNEKQDVWACGILQAILLTGQPPIQQDKSSQLLIHTIMQGAFQFDKKEWEQVSPSALACVKQLLEVDEKKRPSAVNSLNDKWILNLARKRTNQKKILDPQVLNRLKRFIAEYRVMESICDLLQQAQVNKLEERKLIALFQKEDRDESGDLKIDQIRAVYADYCGFLADNELTDKILAQCTVKVNKQGKISYQQFLEIKSKRQFDQFKRKMKNKCAVYDQQMSLENETSTHHKQGHISRDEFKKIMGAILRSPNNQSDSFINEVDQDQDGFLSINETVGLVLSLYLPQ